MATLKTTARIFHTKWLAITLAITLAAVLAAGGAAFAAGALSFGGNGSSPEVSRQTSQPIITTTEKVAAPQPQTIQEPSILLVPKGVIAAYNRDSKEMHSYDPACGGNSRGNCSQPPQIPYPYTKEILGKLGVTIERVNDNYFEITFPTTYAAGFQYRGVPETLRWRARISKDGSTQEWKIWYINRG